MEKAPAIGIDFGTCKLCIGVFQNGNVEIIPNDYGEKITPSYFAFNNNKKYIGYEAKNQLNIKSIIFNIKRLIGYNFDDNIIQEYKKYWPFELVKDSNSNKIKIQINYNNEKKEYYIEEVIASEFQKLKKFASEYLHKEVKEVVIGVPVSFNSLQREIIKDSANIAGLNVLRIVNDTTLSCMAFDFNMRYKKEEICLIFDFGGGFLNLSICTLEGGLIEVQSVNGNNHLGGEDIDNKLIEYCIGEFLRKSNINISSNYKAIRKLKKECEKAKKILSSSKKATIDIESLINGEDLILELNRDKFEEICSDIFKKIIPPLERLLKDAKMSKEQIYKIILVGGSSRIPKIQSMIQEFFNDKQLIRFLNPYEAVSIGAAIQAAIMTNDKNEYIETMIILDVSPFSLGFETVGGVMTVLIPRNSCKRNPNI